jgi:glycosyltransferase involved in cell wall biosynthesis
LPARVRAERPLVIAGKYGWGADELRTNLEAFAAGTPAIATDFPVLREVAGDAATFVVPRDVDALAQETLDAAVASADPAAWEARRDRGRQFDWATCPRRSIRIGRRIRRRVSDERAARLANIRASPIGPFAPPTSGRAQMARES